MKRVLVNVVILLLFSVTMVGQVIYQPEDSVIFSRYIKEIKPKSRMPLRQLVVETALFFRNTPYVASTLKCATEQLVVNLREMDCTTFVESTIALARTAKERDSSFKTYCRNLQQLRYRENPIVDYTSRLHYTTDWIFTNQQRGLVKDISQEIGGVALPFRLNFMSSHPDKYRELRDNPEMTDKIRKQEEEVNKRPHYYIPAKDINNVASKVRSGDIVCFTTTIAGLDVSHVGFAYWENGRLTFIHASSLTKKVIVNPESMQTYVEGSKNNQGVLFVRVMNK